jgi:hypothetical protein
MMIKNIRIVLAVLWAAAVVVEATVRCVSACRCHAAVPNDDLVSQNAVRLFSNTL